MVFPDEAKLRVLGLFAGLLGAEPQPTMFRVIQSINAKRHFKSEGVELAEIDCGRLNGVRIMMVPEYFSDTKCFVQ